jgi:bifunctional non-homologous end joining protein LigD
MRVEGKANRLCEGTGCRAGRPRPLWQSQLLTRTGLDWSKRYRFTIKALEALPVKSAYLDGELCALGPDGVPTFSRRQATMDEGRTSTLVLMAFGLLFLDGESTAGLPLIERKDRLRSLLARPAPGLRFADHIAGDGPRFREHACKAGVEGVISFRRARAFPTADLRCHSQPWLAPPGHHFAS